MDISVALPKANISTLTRVAEDAAINTAAAKVDAKGEGTKTNLYNDEDAKSVLQGNNALRPYLTVSEKAVINSIEHINKLLEGADIQIEYYYHKASNTPVIKLVNSETNEVIKEIPPEKFLDMLVERMKILGLYVDERG